MIPLPVFRSASEEESIEPLRLFLLDLLGVTVVGCAGGVLLMMVTLGSLARAVRLDESLRLKRGAIVGWRR